MIYHVNVKDTNAKEFSQIITSLKSLGIIESFRLSKGFIRNQEPLDEQTLLNILENSKQEIRDGESFTMDEIKQQITSWKKK